MHVSNSQHYVLFVVHGFKREVVTLRCLGIGRKVSPALRDWVAILYRGRSLVARRNSDKYVTVALCRLQLIDTLLVGQCDLVTVGNGYTCHWFTVALYNAIDC